MINKLTLELIKFCDRFYCKFDSIGVRIQLRIEIN